MIATPTIIENASSDQIADWLSERIGQRLANRSTPLAITVPGGSTPFPILERLVERGVAMDRLLVWPNDDREVAEDHEASNTGRIRRLLEPAGAEVVTLSIMEQVPRFDLAWLGMGADGHIASLFPNTDPRADDTQRIRRITPDPLPPNAPFSRITLTLPALLDSDEIVFVIKSEDKRAVFDAAAAGDNDLPIARLLAAATQPVTCFA